MKEKIISSAKKRILFLPHAIKQMSRPDRMITINEVKKAIFNGEIIEEYPEDLRGKSCLVCHILAERYLHIVCAPKDEYLAIITVYIPNQKQWSSDFKMRK